MPTTRVFGVETEHCYTHLPDGESALDRPQLLNLIQELAPGIAPCVKASDGRGWFLASGSRFYLDWTSNADKPELATPECCDPVLLVRSIQEGDAFMGELAHRVEQQIGGQMLFSKTNVDYASSNTWGCHESYLIRRGCDFQKDLIPFLCSRIIFTGSGGFNNLSHGAEFLLSPRVPHIQRIAGYDTQSNRPIINTRDESFSPAADFRIHLILGEGLLGETANLLKVSTTAIVVGLIEAGLHPADGMTLKNPLGALRRYAADPSCGAAAKTETGRSVRAVDVQHHYLRLAQDNLHHLPVWAEAVCELWGQVLNGLEFGQEQRTLRLDWVIRRHVLGQYLRTKGLTWQALEDPDAMTSFAEIRAELFELDTKIGRIGEFGLFHMLDSQGCLRHRVQVADFPPDPNQTRAKVRGAMIQDACERGVQDSVRAEWNFLRNKMDNTELILRHPLADNSVWTPREEEKQSPDRAARFRLLREDPPVPPGNPDTPF